VSTLRQIARLIRRVIGAPDYAGYLAHMREHHPNVTPLDPREFERQRLAARYERPGARCC
jgi:uncharacterized short protein YbdD (DUF466 family)